jgi:indolepyruvate ferredoxin oxidoreductase beta subunit
MERITNIALVGVGGQGILLASEVISRAALLSSQDVKKSEVHGMAQRGGSVVSQIRFGEKIYSPLIPDGDTDFLVSFEMLESLRYADTLAPDGTALINHQVITPVTVSSGQQPWIEDLEARIEQAFPRRRIITAFAIAQELGNIRVLNMVMAGALSRLLDIGESTWKQAIADLVPARYRDVNLQAFESGQAA